MNWFTDKIYDLAASPRGGEGAWGELAAQDAMSPAVRASYWAGSEMPRDPRIAGWRSPPRMGDTVAPPSDTAWMLPPEGPARVDAPAQEVARRFGASGLTPPPARSEADAYRMGGMANMDEYQKAPDTAWRDIDRQAIEDQYGGADLHGIKLPPVSADEPRAWRDAIIGETPADALVNWGLGGTGKLAKGALALGGLFKLADPAEAGPLKNVLKVLRGAEKTEPGFVYHATNEERAADIAREGLRRHRPHEFTDQTVWPDGSTQLRNYFTPTAENTWQFAPEEGQGALLRIGREAHPFKTESTGDLYSVKDVPAANIEGLTNEGWANLVELAKKYGLSLAAASALVGSSTDPAEAANPLKVLRSTSAFEAGKPGPQEFWHRIANRKLDRPLADIPVEYSGKAPPMSSLVDPATLEGKFLMPLPGDPTMRGRTIRSIDDVPLSVPFQTHGGRPYIDELGGYANAPGNAATAAGRVKQYQDKYDTDVLGAYMKMSPQSGDFSHHSWGLLSRMFPEAPMTKDAVTEMNQAIKERTGLANFPSVKNPRLETFVAAQPDATRKAFITAVEQARGKIEGVPDMVAARYAVTEPQLLNTPTSSSGLTMTKLTGETSKSTHPDYPRHLEGEGSFGLGQMLPREVMFSDMIKQFDKMPAYKDQPDRWIRALHTHPPTRLVDYGQLATPQWVDTTSKYMENVGKMGQTAAFDDYLRNVLKWK